MPNSMLRDFIALVPYCEQTTQIAVVLEILAQRKSDRLVIVSNRQHPLGLLYPARLLSYLLEDRTDSKLQLPLSALAEVPNLIEPLKTLPADWSLEQFKLYLGQEQLQNATDSERALVDNLGRFVGLLDSQRLLQYWVLTQQQQLSDRQVLNALLEILDKLPLPLVLQSNTGKTIFENSAWQENFSLWQDTEAVKQEIAELLNTPTISQPETLSTANVYHEPQSEQNLERLYQTDTPSDRLEQNPPETALPQGSRCQLTGKPGTCVCICPTSGGQEKVWEFEKIPLSNDLESSDRQQSWHKDLWLLVATDISEQQQLASELAAKNADLIQLNRLKDEFLACISHELKTPITAVMGLSTLLKDRALGELNERQARYAKLIHQSGRHLMAVVNDILDLTRMETGQLKLTLEPVQIRIVCDRALEQAKAMQPKTSTSEDTEDSSDRRFNLTIAPELDLLIADEMRLRQMLVNLLSNAFKFTDPGGEVGLQVSRWEGWIAFTVWDTGIGIADAQQHLIFQKFQQLENPLTRQFEGTGLGLVLTRALARLHGGDVTFISQQGQGSTFTLLLPPSPPQPTVAENGDATNNLSTLHQKRSLPTHTYSSLLPTPPSPPTPHTLKGLPDSSSNFQLHCNHLVLVVEAAPKFIEALSTQLTGFGYRVVVARTGTEALEKARRVQPGFIFLNPLLPMLSGWDVLTLLKSDAATSQVPVIITATRAEKEQALLNRADDFLSLPIQNSSLQQVLERYCALLPVFVPGDNISPIPRRDLLTVLWLVTPFQSSLLNLYASKLHYRVLEADDLEQAELLARLWQPDVVVLDGSLSDPLAYLQQLRQYRRLPNLPLVTLDPEITQAATQVPELSIFPCPLLESDSSLDTLVTVLQTAAGIRWKPNLSVVDLATLADLPELDNQKLETDGALQMSKNEWFQALIQYLHSAGFKSTLGRSWLELIQQIRSHSIDLLIISWGNFPVNAQAIEAVRVLSQQDKMPPILVIDRRSSPKKPKNSRELANILDAIATRILPPSVSMEELLNHIHQALKKEE
ncbi:hypothetical protein UH38_18525 [Aliterella atlantica CENA595]|uniref:histidine kinase n=2 Tax=Aliterella TaxID=1827277 RepID=A0A0D8ZT08_9CYAN|nr:hypothetical protein UH38_18525 [Aliterella atlantica CENA595]